MPNPNQNPTSDTLQAQLAQLSRDAALCEMAGGIAHELNQPLAAIATYAQACTRMLANPQADLQQVRLALNEVTTQALRAGELIRALRQRLGHYRAQLGPVNLNELVTAVVFLAEAEAQRAQVQLTLELAADLPELQLDLLPLQYVLLELLRNAIEAQHSSAADQRQIYVGTRQLPGGEFEVFVRDQGPGVPAELSHRLLEPLFSTRADKAGLGLAIGSSVARAQGGSLGHRANTPTGAEFYLRLLASEAETAL
jgi:two-component system sensor kinase FixL